MYHESSYKEIEKFLSIYMEFKSVETWTKEKHKLRDSIFEVISNKKTKYISIHRHSVNCLIRKSQSFLFIKVHSKRKGFLKPFRNKWLFIYSQSDRFYMFYTINILSDNFEPKIVYNIGDRLKFNLSDYITLEDPYEPPTI